MKTRINHIAAVTLLALFILVGNVSAEGTEKSASSHENIEAALEIENWMVSDNLWDNAKIITIEDLEEETFELENWMLAENTWEFGNTAELETEKALEFEPWMTNENIWN